MFTKNELHLKYKFPHYPDILPSRVNPKLVAMCPVINSGDRPRDANAQEYVHSITSSHVSNTRVCVFVLDGCHLAGEGVRDAGTESDEHDSGDAVLDAECGAEMWSHVADHGSYDADAQDGDHETEVAVGDIWNMRR